MRGPVLAGTGRVRAGQPLAESTPCGMPGVSCHLGLGVSGIRPGKAEVLRGRPRCFRGRGRTVSLAW